MKLAIQDPVRNSLLAALPDLEYQRLHAALEPVQLALGDVLYEPGEPVRYIYFPENCLASVLAVEQDGMMLEIWQIGREGAIGLIETKVAGSTPARARVQAGGAALRIEATRFMRELRRSQPLQRLLYEYALRLMLQANQIAVCSHFHVLEARLARSLLTTRDRLGSDEFHITHEFLALTLGVRRVGVTKAANALQKRRLISYSRGEVRILDGAALEAVSCRCYQVVKEIDGQQP